MSRSTLLTQLRERVLARIQRGPLLDISIGRSARRFDLLELGNDDPQRAYQALDHIVSGQSAKLTLPLLENPDQEITQEDVDANLAILKKIESIKRIVSLYQRETGVNPLYLGFPLLMLRERDVAGAKGRCIVAPLFVWPLNLETSRVRQGEVLIGFDRERGLVHENPALVPWLKDHFAIDVDLQKAAEDLSSAEQLSYKHVLLTAQKTLEGFQRTLSMQTDAPLTSVPSKDSTIPPNEPRVYPSGAVSVIDWIHQSIVNDLAKLAADPSDMDLLDTFLGLRAPTADNEPIDEDVPETDHFFIADADPVQQKAVFRARRPTGLLLHGPPGTGKSQTIVNVVIDAVARGEKVLVVCQKQAAINVVAKRLAKEGLRNLALVIHDAMKDRVQIIDELKNHLAGWRFGGTSSVEERRNIVCAQIVEIERELRSYNEALWTSKSRGGLSYRKILARLVSLSGQRTLLRAQAELRPLLAQLTHEQVHEIADRIAEIAPVWQQADLTNNFWQFVKPFDFSADSRHEITRLLQASRKDIDARDNHIKKLGNLIPNIDRTALQMWLRDHEQLFSAIDGAQLITWIIPWCRFVASQTQACLAPQLLQGLRAIVHELYALKNEESRITWLSRLSALEPPQLHELQKYCEAHMRRDQRWFRKLLPLNKNARTALKRCAAQLNATYDALFVSQLFRHCRHLLRLHEILADLHQKLSTLDVNPLLWTLSASVIHDEASKCLRMFQNADRVSIAIDSCPLKTQLVETVKEHSVSAINLMINTFRESCTRSILDGRARASIAPLRDYLDAGFPAAIDSYISQQRTLAFVIDNLSNKLQSVPVIQRFRFFKGRLPDNARVVFDILAAASLKDDVASDNPTQTWQNTIEVSALIAWKKELESTHPQLIQVPSDHYISQIKKLERLEAEKKKLNRGLLFAKQNRLPVAPESSWRTVLVKKGRTSKRLRQVVSMGSVHGIFNLRPVWLTNPETVSQIFPLKNGLFDLVIFDEASQLPPEFAVGALFRSKRAVVSGDEHQLPPTSFFQAGVDLSSDSEIETQLDELEKRLEDEGDDPQVVAEYERVQQMAQTKSSENLLAMAKPILPHSWLTIHYRSRAAELIRFSNAAFYENKLRMPTAHPPETLSRQKPIRVHRIDSTYGADQTNPGEANAIVNYLRNLWLKDDVNIPTAGVVTFNIHQRDAILDALKLEAERDRIFADILTREENRKDGEEDIGFFVKNLENVQGDERDIMIFSTTFGRRADGKFARFFGPLSQNGGQRRLNVAVTRARDRIEIFTSVPTNQISDALSRPLESIHSGVKPRDIFQLYLAYAEACDVGSHERVQEILRRAACLSYGGFAGAPSAESYDSDFEMLVADELRRNGFKVHTQVNEGEFRIDLAIVHPTQPRYALGIECDGATFHSSWSARSHDIWRQRVLESCGWKIHRIWSTEWWRNHSVQVDALLHAAQHACS
jgi:primosomal replication protein N''